MLLYELSNIVDVYMLTPIETGFVLVSDKPKLKDTEGLLIKSEPKINEVVLI